MHIFSIILDGFDDEMDELLMAEEERLIKEEDRRSSRHWCNGPGIRMCICIIIELVMLLSPRWV